MLAKNNLTVLARRWTVVVVLNAIIVFEVLLARDPMMTGQEGSCLLLLSAVALCWAAAAFYWAICQVDQLRGTPMYPST